MLMTRKFAKDIGPPAKRRLMGKLGTLQTGSPREIKEEEFEDGDNENVSPSPESKKSLNNKKNRKTINGKIDLEDFIWKQ